MKKHIEIWATSWQTNKISVHQAKTQISLGIRPVWSESSLTAWRKLGTFATHWAHSEASDQTGRMTRLIWVFAGRTCQYVGFVTRRLIWFLSVWMRFTAKSVFLCGCFLFQRNLVDDYLTRITGRGQCSLCHTHLWYLSGRSRVSLWATAWQN